MSVGDPAANRQLPFGFVGFCCAANGSHLGGTADIIVDEHGHVCDYGNSVCYFPCFVKNYPANLVCGHEGLTAFDQEDVLSSNTGTDHDCSGGDQTESAGASDRQHSDGILESFLQNYLSTAHFAIVHKLLVNESHINEPGHDPAEQHSSGRDAYAGHKVVGYFVSQVLCRYL